jgi:LCP family protein required for cell wall assembly
VSAPEARHPARSPALAAALSFIFPGLGQAYAGSPRSARRQALPALLLLAVALVLIVALSPAVVFAYLFQWQNALLAGALVIGFGAWRAYSIVHATRTGQLRAAAAGQRRSGSVAALLLVALVVVMHGYATNVVWSAYQAGVTISARPTPTPTVVAGSPSASPSSGGPTGSPATPGPATPTPSVAPTPEPQGRVTILFLGRDLGRGSEGQLTDSLQVVSFDPRTREIVFISVPRDTGQLPLYSGGVWPTKINALMAYAESHPEEFPDGGLGTLRRELEYIIGIPIHYSAQVDFVGFVQLVDAVGGVDVVVEREIDDPTYYQFGRLVGFHITPGPHHLDGLTALAYARSRHGVGNSDFQRARRQQEVLLAIRDRINDPTVLANLPTVIDIAAQYVRTDVPLERLPEIIGLLEASNDAEVKRYVLRPRDYAEVIPRDEVGRVYMTRLKMDAVAALSIELFGDESRYAHLDE